MKRTGTDALPIVALMSLLVGFVTAFSSAIQLRQFGANIYIADLVGIGMTREMGPLMAAIRDPLCSRPDRPNAAPVSVVVATASASERGGGGSAFCLPRGLCVKGSSVIGF